MSVAKISMQVEGRLPDLITQSPHALVVSHGSALFVFLCLLWPFPAKIPLPHFANASKENTRLKRLVPELSLEKQATGRVEAAGSPFNFVIFSTLLPFLSLRKTETSRNRQKTRLSSGPVVGVASESRRPTVTTEPVPLPSTIFGIGTPARRQRRPRWNGSSGRRASNRTGERPRVWPNQSIP